MALGGFKGDLGNDWRGEGVQLLFSKYRKGVKIY